MIYGLVLTVHILVCTFLIIVILLQGGRGGLAESMGGGAAQSLFGGGASTVLTKITAYVAAGFFVTCLTLAGLSSMRGKSVVDQMPLELPAPGSTVIPTHAPAEAPGVEPGDSAVPVPPAAATP